MKNIGIVLILIQVLSYASNTFKIPEGPISSQIGYLLGSNIFGIIGVIFLVKGMNQDTKTEKNEKDKKS